MTMKAKTLLSLAPVSALYLLAACGGSPVESVGPGSTPAVTTPAGDPSEPPMETPSVSVDPPASPSAEATSSEDSDTTDELPPMLSGKWIDFQQGESPKECTEVEYDSDLLTIDATTISSWGFTFTLLSIEESSDDNLVGLFDLAIDDDEDLTPRMKLVTTDGWQTFELIELDTEDPSQMLYARCS